MDRAGRLFGDMKQRSVVSCTAMLKAYAQAGNVPMARKVFDQMSLKNIVSWNVLLATDARNGYPEEATLLQRRLVDSHDRDMSMVKSVFDGMPERNMVSFTAYAENGELESAMVMFDQMPDQCAAFWAAMVTAYAHKGHLEEARLLLEDMALKDVIAITAVMAAYGGYGRLLEARKMFEGMEHAYAAYQPSAGALPENASRGSSNRRDNLHGRPGSLRSRQNLGTNPGSHSNNKKI